MEDHGEMPIEDFTHILLKSVIYIRWSLVGIFILAATSFYLEYIA